MAPEQNQTKISPKTKAYLNRKVVWLHEHEKHLKETTFWILLKFLFYKNRALTCEKSSLSLVEKQLYRLRPTTLDPQTGRRCQIDIT